MTHSAWNTAVATDRSLAHKQQKSDSAAVCEWDRNEENQGRFNRAPIDFKDLGVLRPHQVFGLAYLGKSSVYVSILCV